MRGIICFVFVLFLTLGSSLPYTYAATPIPTLTTASYAAALALNDLVPPTLPAINLPVLLGGADFVGRYVKADPILEFNSGIDTHVSTLPTYPLTTNNGTACAAYSGDAPSTGGYTGSTYTWQQYLNLVNTLGGAAFAAAFGQRVVTSVGYYVGAGAKISVPYINFTGAPTGAPSPPSTTRSTVPIWGIVVSLDPLSIRDRFGSTIPTFAPTAAVSGWTKIADLLTPPSIGILLGNAYTTVNNIYAPVGKVIKLRLDIFIPALLVNILRPTIQVCDYVSINTYDPTNVAALSATVVKTAVPATTPASGVLTYYNLGSNWTKVLTGSILGYRLHCSAVSMSWCVIKIYPPNTGYFNFSYYLFSPSISNGTASCSIYDNICYYYFSSFGATPDLDISIYCNINNMVITNGKHCPDDVYLSSAVVIAGTLPCTPYCVNFGATRTAAIQVTPTLTQVPIISTYVIVPTATNPPVYIPPTSLPATSVLNSTLTRTSQAAIFSTQTALSNSSQLTKTAASAQNTATTVARTATAGAYINYGLTATAIQSQINATATARINQTSVAVATVTYNAGIVLTAIQGGTSVVAATLTRAIAVDNGISIYGRDAGSVFGVTDKLLDTTIAGSSLKVLGDVFTSFTNGLISSPCIALPSIIDGVSLNTGWSLPGMGPAMCVVRSFLASLSISTYIRGLASILIIVSMFSIAFRLFVKPNE